MKHSDQIKEYFNKRSSIIRPKSFSPEKINIIAFTNRSGSTYLGHLFRLGGLGGETLKDKNFEYLNYDNVRSYSELFWFSDFSQYANWAIENSRGKTGFSTIKGNSEQIEYLASSFDTISPSVRIFHIKRRNIVAQAISLSRALQTGAWTNLHNSRGAFSYDARQIEDCCRVIIRGNENIITVADGLGIKLVPLYYEDIVDTPTQTLLNIQTILQVPWEDVDINKIPIKKQSDEITVDYVNRFCRTHPRFENYKM